MGTVRKWLTFNKGERIAIITIMAVIVILILACIFRPTRKSLSDATLHDLDSLLALRQAAVEEQSQRQAERVEEVAELHPFPFNPNTLTEEEGRRMGLTDRQVRNIINYRDKGGKFYSKKDLAKLYSISDDDFAQLEPYIVLPEVVRNENNKAKTEMKENQKVEIENAKPKTIPVVDLNTVDSVTLVELPQIGPYIASRIIAYRSKLGGFVDLEQLRDVKGMDSARYETVRPYMRIGEGNVEKIDVNRADFKALVNHPYLNYNQVKCIVNQREKRGMIKDWKQLESLCATDFPLNPNLVHYVKF